MIKIALIQMHVEEDKYKNKENASEFVKKDSEFDKNIKNLKNK